MKTKKNSNTEGREGISFQDQHDAGQQCAY